MSRNRVVPICNPAGGGGGIQQDDGAIRRRHVHLPPGPAELPEAGDRLEGLFFPLVHSLTHSFIHSLLLSSFILLLLSFFPFPQIIHSNISRAMQY